MADGTTGGSSRALAWVVAASLAVNAGVVVVATAAGLGAESHDYVHHYFPVAESLADGRGLVAPDGEPATRTPPGYPAVLAALLATSRATGAGMPELVFAFNAFCAVLSSVLVHRLGLLFAGPRAALLAALLWTTYPLGLYADVLASTEQPFVPVFLAAVLALAAGLRHGRHATFAAAGAAFGAAALVRPFVAFLPPLLAVGIAASGSGSRRVRATRAVLFLACWLAFVAPWSVHASAALLRFVPVSPLGPAALADGLTFALGPSREPGRAPSPEVVEVQTRIRARIDGAATGGVAGALIDELAADPLPVLRLVAIKACRAWYGTDSLRWDDVVLAIQVPYLILGLFGLVALSRAPPAADRRLALTLLGVIAYFWIVTTAALSIARYTYPVMPIVILFGAIGIDRAWRGAMLRGRGGPSQCDSCRS